MDHMSIYEVIGMMWVILATTCASVFFFYAAYLGIRTAIEKIQSDAADVVVSAIPQSWKQEGD